MGKSKITFSCERDGQAEMSTFNGSPGYCGFTLTKQCRSETQCRKRKSGYHSDPRSRASPLDATAITDDNPQAGLLHPRLIY